MFRINRQDKLIEGESIEVKIFDGVTKNNLSQCRLIFQLHLFRTLLYLLPLFQFPFINKTNNILHCISKTYRVLRYRAMGIFEAFKHQNHSGILINMPTINNISFLIYYK